MKQIVLDFILLYAIGNVAVNMLDSANCHWYISFKSCFALRVYFQSFFSDSRLCDICMVLVHLVSHKDLFNFLLKTSSSTSRRVLGLVFILKIWEFVDPWSLSFYSVWVRLKWEGWRFGTMQYRPFRGLTQTSILLG